MEWKPKLRPLEAFPVDQDGKKMVALRDPLGIFPGAAVVTPEFFLIVSLFDGKKSLEEIQSLLLKNAGLRASTEELKKILENLDRHLLLENDRFQTTLKKEIENFTNGQVRPPFHAGQGYPKTPEQARQHIEEMLRHGQESKDVDSPTALLTPHIDFFRGAKTYGKTYSILRNHPRVDCVVILGTSHSPTENLLCLTRKDFGTPFGQATTDREFVEGLAKRLPGKPFVDEFCHRTEHSVEFQAHFIKYLLPKTPIVPILCGALQSRIPPGKEPGESQEIETSIAALRELLRERKNTLLILGVDLAHVGPRFGSSKALNPSYLQSVEKEDRDSLEHVARLDSESFFHSVVDGGDPRNVCGLSPIYLGLRILENGRGKLLDYSQCMSADQCVTIAGMVFTPPNPLGAR